MTWSGDRTLPRPDPRTNVHGVNGTFTTVAGLS